MLLFSGNILFGQKLTPDTAIRNRANVLYNKRVKENADRITFNKTHHPITKYFKKDSSGKKAIDLHGTAKLESQVASGRYSLQQTPLNYTRFEITPQISLWGIPFTSRINLTTEQQYTNYRLNRISFNLDVPKLRQLLSDTIRRHIESRIENNPMDSIKGVLEEKISSKNIIDEEIKQLQENIKDNKTVLRQYEKKVPDIENYDFSDSFKSIELKDRLLYEEYSSRRKQLEQQTDALDSLHKIQKQLESYEKQYKKLAKKGYFNQGNSDINSLKKTPSETLIKKYGGHGLLTPVQKFLLSIRNFNVGVVNPSYSPIFIQGVPLTGFLLENGFRRGLYSAIAVGFVQQNLDFASLKQHNDKKYIALTKLGYGMPENSHIHFGILKAGFWKKDNQPKTDAALTAVPTPDENTVGFVDGRLTIMNGLAVNGQLATSYIAKNTYVSTPAEQAGGMQQNVLKQPNTAFLIEATGEVPQSKTRITGRTTYTGPSFFTAGNPYLRTDLFRKEIKVSQKLYKEFISLDAGYQNDRDNLLNQKRFTTFTNNYKAAVNIRLKKWPSFMLSYNAIEQSNQVSEGQAGIYKNLVSIYTLTTVYVKRIKTNTWTNTLTLIKQDIDNNLLDRVMSYYTGVFSSNYSLKSISVSYQSSLNIQRTLQENRIFNSQADVLYTYPKRAKNISAMGAYYTVDQMWGNNYGISARQSLSFWKDSQISLMLKHTVFKTGTNTVHQTIANIQVIQQW